MQSKIAKDANAKLGMPSLLHARRIVEGAAGLEQVVLNQLLGTMTSVQNEVKIMRSEMENMENRLMRRFDDISLADGNANQQQQQERDDGHQENLHHSCSDHVQLIEDDESWESAVAVAKILDEMKIQMERDMERRLEEMKAQMEREMNSRLAVIQRELDVRKDVSLILTSWRANRI